MKKTKATGTLASFTKSDWQDLFDSIGKAWRDRRKTPWMGSPVCNALHAVKMSYLEEASAEGTGLTSLEKSIRRSCEKFFSLPKDDLHRHAQGRYPNIEEVDRVLLIGISKYRLTHEPVEKPIKPESFV